MVSVGCTRLGRGFGAGDVFVMCTMSPGAAGQGLVEPLMSAGLPEQVTRAAVGARVHGGICAGKAICCSGEVAREAGYITNPLLLLMLVIRACGGGLGPWLCWVVSSLWGN
jgi:hypothetical protein